MDNYFNVQCSVQILNLIVQEGLKVPSDALFKIGESVKYVIASDVRMIQFKECVHKAKVDDSAGLKLDVSTGWNSTYMMLESAIKFEKPFDLLNIIDTNYNYCPSDEEWRTIEKMCKFLEPFYESTNLISS